MKFFLDTANLDQIREANDLGVLDGVTTNPSLMAKEGIRGEENIRNHYVEICRIVGGDVSAEVISTDFEGMVREGEVLADLDPHIVVKVPCIADGIKAIRHFTTKGIRTNCTLVFSPGQALLAAKAGATYVSPFVGKRKIPMLDDMIIKKIAYAACVPNVLALACAGLGALTPAVILQAVSIILVLINIVNIFNYIKFGEEK